MANPFVDDASFYAVAPGSAVTLVGEYTVRTDCDAPNMVMIRLKTGDCILLG